MAYGHVLLYFMCHLKTCLSFSDTWQVFLRQRELFTVLSSWEVLLVSEMEGTLPIWIRTVYERCSLTPASRFTKHGKVQI